MHSDDADEVVFPPEVLERYLNRRMDDLANGRAALQKQDWKTLLTIGHQLRGTAASYGFPKFGEIGAVIEIEAGKGHPGIIEEKLREFEGCLKKYALKTYSQPS